METILVILSLALITALIINLLHKHQQKESQDNLDRSTPLPIDTAMNFELPFDEPVGNFPSRNTPTHEVGVENIEGAELNTAKTSPSKSPTNTHPVATPIRNQPPAELSWLQQVRNAREANSFENSLNICLQHLPKAQAFKQMLVTYRARIRTQLNNDEDAEQSLNDLYRVAVIADLYRKGADLPPLQDSPETARNLLRELKVDYKKIGYESLNSLIKSDLKLLLQSWGEPELHSHAEVQISKEKLENLKAFSNELVLDLSAQNDQKPVQ